jgi:hypothetical protein
MQDDDEREAAEVWARLDREPGLCVRNWLAAVRDKTKPVFVWSSVRQQQPIENRRPADRASCEAEWMS